MPKSPDQLKEALKEVPPGSPLERAELMEFRADKARENGQEDLARTYGRQSAEAHAMAAETETKLLEAPHAPEAAQHAARIAVEQAQAGEQIVPVNIDHSGIAH